MSAVKAKGRKLLKRIRPDERIKIALFLSLLLSCLSGIIMVSRIRPQGAAYFFTSIDVVVFFLILLPLGASEALHDLILKRAQIGFLKNAKRIFTSAFIHVAVYVLLIMIIWGLLALKFSENFLFGKAGYTTLLWGMPLFAADAFIMILRGYSDGYYRGHHSSYALLFRQALLFVLMVIFAGRDSSSGLLVSKLLRNEEVAYIYDAIGSLRILLIVSVLCVIILFILLLGGHPDRRVKRAKDNNRKHESPTGQFYSFSFPLSGAAVCFLSFHYASLLMFGRTYRNGKELLQPYIWGMYSGIAGMLYLMPLGLIFLLLYNSLRLTGNSIKREDRGELRIRCMNLSGEAMIICFFFVIFYLAAGFNIPKGLFGVDSALAVRLVYFGAIPLLFCAIALNTSMQLIILRCRRRLMLHCVIALIPSVALMQFMPGVSIASIGIYSLIVSAVLFYLIITVLNYVHLIQYVHYSLDFLRVLILPALCSLAPGVAVFLLGLLFSLFMPALLNVIICFILYTCGWFFAICKSGLISVYSLRRIPLGRFIGKLGRKLHLLGEEE